MSRKTKQTRNYENRNKGMFPTEGKYEIPVISCERYSKREWIGFPMAGSCKGEHRKGKGIHFFVDDYQFIRLWNQIDRYIPMLASYGWMLSPDFSLYTDFPVSLQIYNHFRKHWLGAYLQRNGNIQYKLLKKRGG